MGWKEISKKDGKEMKDRIVIGRNEDTSEIVKKFPNRSGEHIDFIEIFTPHENCKFEQVPETWEELKELCKELEEKTKGKKRVVYCTLLGEIFVYLEDSFGKVAFCLSLKNIENPNRDMVHIKIINFKLNILYNSFDMPLSNSINFIKSLIGEE